MRAHSRSIANSGIGNIPLTLAALRWAALFAEEGFGASTRRLASRLGVTQAALYKHFRSKDDIVAAAALFGSIASVFPRGLALNSSSRRCPTGKRSYLKNSKAN
nr:helix-turn-helix domain-containing protein [Rhizobium sullae]